MNLDLRSGDVEKRPVSQLGSERVLRWNDVTRIYARLAGDPSVQRDAFALRYKSYLADGHINPNATELFSDGYDNDPNSRTFVVYSGRDAVGSARISTLDIADGSSEIGRLPANTIFADEVKELVQCLPDLGRPKRVVEVARLVRDPAFAADNKLIFLLFRLVGHLVTELNADIVLSCPRRNHLPFYRKLLFEVIAGPRPYPNVNFDAYLMACKRDDIRRLVPIRDVDQYSRSVYYGLLQGCSAAVSEVIPT